METITIEIDKRTKIGKTFLEMIEAFAKNNKKEVKILEERLVPNKATAKILRKNRNKKGTKAKNAADMFKKMGIDV
ncbi:MAG TPA: hypothetical protein VFM65_10660 [Flavobacteriaceae bacterium]|nr:hypothetical protein [Flavobacteriaceae bacterium]